MINPLFLLRIVLAFLVGSFWITYSTVIAQKFGSKIGGVLGGMPSTIVIGLFFIGWTQSPEVAANAAILTPIVMGISSLFIATYIYLLRYNFLFALITSLGGWFVLSLSLLLINFNNLKWSMLCFVVMLFFSYFIVEHVLKIKSVEGQQFKPSKKNLLYRGLFSGTVIASSVILANVGGQLVGGIFASFPAVFLSNMVISYNSEGADFSAGLMKALMISGTINVTIYALAVIWLYPLFGLVGGTLLAFFVSMCSVFFVFQIVKKIT